MQSINSIFLELLAVSGSSLDHKTCHIMHLQFLESFMLLTILHNADNTVNDKESVKCGITAKRASKAWVSLKVIFHN